MFLLALLSSTFSQGRGTADVHPKISYKVCTKSGCTPKNGGIVIDSEWREIVTAEGKPCLKSNGDFDIPNVCKDAADCSDKCLLNGYTYSKASVSTSGSAVRLGFLNPDGSIGSRVYLFDEDLKEYQVWKMVGKEITFDIDTSTLGCGTNGALYFSEMDADGGSARFPRNKAGAAYGTGYCDAQCPRDGKFIGNNANVGRKYGSCCFEWDVWEANAYATQHAAHPCGVDTPAYVCESDCQKCDTSGCANNPYRFEAQNGAKTHAFYGLGKQVDTSKKFTVVTQFVSDNGLATGNLKEVRRLYVVNGKVLETVAKIQNGKPYNTIGNDYCTNGSAGDDAYMRLGGDAAFTKSFKRGAVLAMSLWTDGSMGWLDEIDGGGPCKSPGGKDGVIAKNKNSFVEYSNIRYGDIDTTY
jgi:cellulose 1,4-beta-cellobiosidase